MKVKVKFRDTEFGLFEPSVPVSGADGRKYRGIVLNFRADGTPWSQVVLEEALRGQVSASYRRVYNPVFASTTDGVYWIIERILDSERECGEEIEIEYEGEDGMDNKTIEIPADAKTVTLELKRHGGFALRSLLPQVKNEVELVVRDEFGTKMKPDADLYRLRAGSGNTLLRELERSRVVDGESLLDLTPSVRLVEPQASILNGTCVTLTGTGYIQLTVTPHVPED